MELKSSAFKNNEALPTQYTCYGQKMSPPLAWSGFPKEANCFALICEDPDAVGGTFIHWVVYNIPRDVTAFPENGSIAGSMGLTSGHTAAWYPACPPKGTGKHRYIFTLYALKKEFGLTRATHQQFVEALRQEGYLAKATLIGIVQAP